ncbi:MAG TPA: hypothetical protein VGE78_04515, partial [Agromyces sp.]
MRDAREDRRLDARPVMDDLRVVESKRHVPALGRGRISHQVLVPLRGRGRRCVTTALLQQIDEAVDVVALAVGLEDEAITEYEVDPTDPVDHDLRAQFDAMSSQAQAQQRLEPAVGVPSGEVDQRAVPRRYFRAQSSHSSPVDQPLAHRRFERREEGLDATARERVGERVDDRALTQTRPTADPVQHACATVMRMTTPMRRHRDVHALVVIEQPHTGAPQAGDTAEHP